MSGRDPSSPIESLLKLAGERDQPSAVGLERARSAARASWQRALERKPALVEGARPRRRVVAWALAAGVAALVLSALWLRATDAPVLVVAQVSALQGHARIANAGTALVSGAALHAGEVLSTGEGRVALAMGDALSLRLDRGSRLRFDSAGQVTLLAGALYVDSGGLNAHTDLRIDTPAGAVRHVGTQFQVQVHGEQTLVQVREGRVVLTPEGKAPVDLGAGDLAEVAGTNLRVERGLATFGAAWEWAARTAPGFDIENRPLSEFLAWLAREHGWQLRFADEALQLQAREIRLHGSMAGMDAAGMLERVTLVTGVPLAERDGVLLVGAPRP